MDALFYTVVGKWDGRFGGWAMGQRILVTGAARSGKSEWAERLAEKAELNQKTVIYVATSQRYEGDREWDARIDQHIDRRPSSWRTVEVKLDLAACIQSAIETDCLLIDSLGSWVGNGLELDDENWQSYTQELVKEIRTAKADVILVSEETGWGVIPAYPMGRLFRDRLGQVIRAIGQEMDETFLVVAGFAVDVQKIGIAIDRRSKKEEGRGKREEGRRF